MSRCSTKTVGSVLEEATERWGKRDALIIKRQGIRWSYRQLNEAADRLAARLLSIGLVPGDRVGLWAPNRYEWLVTQFATAKAGLILVSMNPAIASRARIRSQQSWLQGASARPSFKTSDYIGVIQQVAPETATSPAGDLRAARLPAVRAPIVTDDRPVAGFLSFGELETWSDRVATSPRPPSMRPQGRSNLELSVHTG
jgi:fatty-acyl-CoA synthase